MENNDFLVTWLASLEESLRITKENIQKLEFTKEENLKHVHVQSKLLKKWIQASSLTPEVRDDLENVLRRITKRDDNASKELAQLKTIQVSTEFMIEKLTEEIEAPSK